MDELKLIFASNLIRLRTGAGLTQAALGEKLNYSDKTISKWERAESMPDASVLKKISEIFNTTVDELLCEDSPRIEPGKTPKSYAISKMDLRWLVIVSIWTVALLVFVVLWMVGIVYWKIFLFCIPATLIAYIVFNSVWRQGKNNMYIVGSLVISIFLVLYFVLDKFHPWKLLLLAVPSLLVVFFSFRIRKKHK